MNNVYELHTDFATYDEASRWIAKIDKRLSPREEAELKQWVRSSARNRKLLFDMAHLWDELDGLARLAELFPEHANTRSMHPLRWAAAIAMLVLAISVAIRISVDWSVPPEMQSIAPVSELGVVTVASVFETGVGEQSSVTLSDGSHLRLNTNSRVEVRFTPESRLLLLQRGELHVSVAHDPDRPLNVQAANRIIQAVGTEFNVEISGDQSIELIVTEGVVLVGVVDSQGAETPESMPVMLSGSALEVTAGHEIVLPTSIVKAPDFENETPVLQLKEPEEIAVKLSWREGNLVFRGESLEEAMVEVGRYTVVEFVFLDEESKKVRVAGRFKAGDVDGLLSALRDNFSIAYEWVGEDKITLSSR